MFFRFKVDALFANCYFNVQLEMGSRSSPFFADPVRVCPIWHRQHARLTKRRLSVRVRHMILLARPHYVLFPILRLRRRVCLSPPSMWESQSGKSKMENLKSERPLTNDLPAGAAGDNRVGVSNLIDAFYSFQICEQEYSKRIWY